MFGLFGPAAEQAAEAAELSRSAFDNPTPDSLAGSLRLRLFPARADMSRVVGGGDKFAHLSVGVARVQA